jgi:hypothetical protein
LHAGAVILRHREECGNIKLDVRRDDGSTDARCGAKEKDPTASSAPSATASAPARLRAVRLFTGRLFTGRLFTGRLFTGGRFTGAGESIGYCLLRASKLALRTGEPGLGGMISGDTGISGLPGQYASPFGTLFLFLVRTGRGP